MHLQGKQIAFEIKEAKPDPDLVAARVEQFKYLYAKRSSAARAQQIRESVLSNFLLQCGRERSWIYDFLKNELDDLSKDKRKEQLAGYLNLLGVPQDGFVLGKLMEAGKIEKFYHEFTLGFQSTVLNEDKIRQIRELIVTRISEPDFKKRIKAGWRAIEPLGEELSKQGGPEAIAGLLDLLSRYYPQHPDKDAIEMLILMFMERVAKDIPVADLEKLAGQRGVTTADQKRIKSVIDKLKQGQSI